MKTYCDLTKSGIVLFVLLGGLIGFAFSHPIGQIYDLETIIVLLVGLYFLSSGSFIVNQAQEWKADSQMKRTEGRPIPAGKIAPWQAYIMGSLFCLIGLLALFLIQPMAAYVGLSSVVLYNIFYTLYWKPRWSFAAVPGAIPGALPVVIGFSVNNPNILTPECVYLFLIMFLWQMPHFWALAIHYKDDYKRGEFPVLPAVIGVNRTLFHIGLYTFAYLGLAMAAPLFVKATFFHLILVVPITFKVLYEFYKYFTNQNKQGQWLPFFLWVNLSLLVFIGVPVADRLLFYYFA